MSNNEKKMHYQLIDTVEKNRIKNNDKSIAALEGKNLLEDSPGSIDKFSGNVWKFHRNHAEYQRKMRLKEKYAKHLAMKMSENASADKSLGIKRGYKSYS